MHLQGDPGAKGLIAEQAFTTDMIEALNRQIRKTIKTRGHFPTEDAARKLIWPAITHASYAAAEMAAYSFLSTWCVAAPIERVWELLSAPEQYPDWWKGVRKVEVLEPGEEGADDVGTLYRLEWRGKLAYPLIFDSRVTRVEPPHLIEGRASGELVGFGVWRLFDGPAGTVALYKWDVSTTRRWMNVLSPLARPKLAWNHDYVMRQGAVGLARKLGAELVAHN